MKKRIPRGSIMEKYELKHTELTKRCDLNCLDFETTESLVPLQGIVGQERAREAMKFGLAMHKKGYNIYVSGSWGTGRNGFVKRLTEEAALTQPAPRDVVYVNNFQTAHSPIALSMKAGEGKNFKKNISRLIAFLRKEIDGVFSSKEYENARASIMEAYQQETNQILQELNEVASEFGFVFSQTDKGIVSIPLQDGEPMSEEAYKEISSEDYEKMRVNSNKLSLETVELFNRLRESEEEFRGKLKNLDEQMGRRVVRFHLMNLKQRYQKNPDVLDYLDAIVEDVVDHIDAFKGEEEEEPNPLAIFQPKNQEDFFQRYRVNLFVDNSGKKSAPVVFESNPTYHNLMGSIEYRNEMGVLATDYTMLKPGALHQANGGYLILLVKDILQHPYAWNALKRTLLDEHLTMETRQMANGAMISASLKPSPIDIDVKVVLIGDPEIYGLLYTYDEEFRKLIKIRADFDYEIERTDDHIDKLARFLATEVEKENLKHLDRHAVGRIVTHAARLADDQEKMTAHFRTLVDILLEADHWATTTGASLIEERHVEKALAEWERRNNRYEEKILEMFEDGTYLIDVSGEKVGEINGLAVVGSGLYRFGKPSKITVSTYRGRSGIINIEREARTSGAIHDKGVMILTGYLGHQFAQDKPLALTASIVFEQLYSGVDGDSASSTELYALLSSLSGVPIRQHLAVTGSVNQRGQIQPIGGVNEKIEGFFKVCRFKGLTGNQGVIIPKQNVKNLLLSEEVIEAVKDGRFHIYYVTHVNEGIELLMGKPAGERSKRGHFPKGTINYLVDKRLKELAEPLLKKATKSTIKAKIIKDEAKKTD